MFPIAVSNSTPRKRGRPPLKSLDLKVANILPAAGSLVKINSSSINHNLCEFSFDLGHQIFGEDHSKENPLNVSYFCIFCPSIFPKGERIEVIDHLTDHILDFNGKSSDIEFIEQRWIQEFVDYQEKFFRPYSNWKQKFWYINCPVCEGMSKMHLCKSKPRVYPSSILEMHMKRHLQYRPFNCLLCSQAEHSNYFGKSLEMKVKNTNGQLERFIVRKRWKNIRSTSPKTYRFQLRDHLRKEHLRAVKNPTKLHLEINDLVQKDESPLLEELINERTKLNAHLWTDLKKKTRKRRTRFSPQKSYKLCSQEQLMPQGNPVDYLIDNPEELNPDINSMDFNVLASDQMISGVEKDELDVSMLQNDDLLTPEEEKEVDKIIDLYKDTSLTELFIEDIEKVFSQI